MFSNPLLISSEKSPGILIVILISYIVASHLDICCNIILIMEVNILRVKLVATTITIEKTCMLSKILQVKIYEDKSRYLLISNNLRKP